MTYRSRKEVNDVARDKLILLMRRLGLTVSAFARLLGVGRSMLERFRNDEASPNPRLLGALGGLDERLATPDELEAFRAARDFDQHHGLA